MGIHKQSIASAGIRLSMASWRANPLVTAESDTQLSIIDGGFPFPAVHKGRIAPKGSWDVYRWLRVTVDTTMVLY